MVAAISVLLAAPPGVTQRFGRPDGLRLRSPLSGPFGVSGPSALRCFLFL
jgi:hypothetical protein